MKKKINVIDLDNTLLPYNSFFRYVLYFIGNLKLFLPIIYLSFLRIIYIIQRDTYQKRILFLTRKIPDYELIVQEFALLLYKDIKKNIVHFVEENTDGNTINILCTSSPEDYVKYFCKKLKDWSYLSSTLNQSGLFYHLYGSNKITVLKQLYPPESYNYNLAISDSKTDLELLKLFDKGYLIKKEKIKKLN